MKELVLSFLLLLSITPTLAQNEESADELYWQARDFYKNGQLGIARSLINESIHLSDNPKSRFLSGLIFEATGRDIRAVAEYEAVHDLDPEHKEAIFKKALLYLRHGDPQQAVKDFTFLISNFNRFHETQSILFQIDETGNRQNRLVTTNTLEPDLYHYRGQAYQRIEEDALALQDFNTAISMAPLPEYYVSRGLYFLNRSIPDSAIINFKQAIVRDSTYHLAWYNLVLADESVVLPDKVAIDNDFAPTLNLLASRAMESGDLSLAKGYLDRAVKLNQEDPLILINRGRLLIKMNRYREARKDFNAALTIDPTKEESLYLIGNTFYYQEDYENALAYYNKYLSINNQSGMVWYNAAICYLELGENLEACHYLQMAGQWGMSQAKAVQDDQCN